MVVFCQVGQNWACPKTRPNLSPPTTFATLALNSGVACRWRRCGSVDSRWRVSHARLTASAKALQDGFGFNSRKCQESPWRKMEHLNAPACKTLLCDQQTKHIFLPPAQHTTHFSIFLGQSHLLCQRRTMWLFLTLFARLHLYRACFRWKAGRSGRRRRITCIEKEDWIRLLAVTGSASDSPWSRPTDKQCIFIKNRPASSSHNKQDCLSAATVPVSVLALAYKLPRFAVLWLLSFITADTNQS